MACEICQVAMMQRGRVPRRYCSIACKAEAQRRTRPVSVEWLREKYIAEQLDCTQIAAMVGRDPKSVWNWLKGSGIPTRSRGCAAELRGQVFKKGEPSKFAGHRHTDKFKEEQRRRRLADGHVPYLKDGVHYSKGKRGAEVHSWKGGSTPERQAFYSSEAWRACAVAVRFRDNNRCRRCGNARTKAPLHLHHLVSFSVSVELRAEPSNLILLCRPCHLWVHSKQNTKKEYIK